MDQPPTTHLSHQDLQARIAPFDPPTEIPAPIILQQDDISRHRSRPPCDRTEPTHRIRFDYHPVSQRCSQIFASYEASLGTAADGVDWEPPSKPYAPFPTFADFDFAEFVTKHRLSSSVVNDLLKRLHSTWANNVLVTMESAGEVEHHVRMSVEPVVRFEEKNVSSSYQAANGDEVCEEHVIFVRSIRDWVSAIVKDPVLFPHFQWHPIRKYHIFGEREVQYIDEPWSGQEWWEDQDAIGNDGSVVSIFIYSDKTTVSSFNGRTFHPVVARIGNLPAPIRNSQGEHGGGTLIAYIPQICDVEEEKSSPEYINYKRHLYHQVLLTVFASIIDSSRVGHGVICADRILRTLFILVKFASGDYEEQVDMTLIRGINSLHPCPVCLVPRDALFDITSPYPSRTAQQSFQAYKMALEHRTRGENGKAEEVLKALSLRAVFNAFWNLEHTDPHHAVCFDILHFFDGGLWGRHMWPELVRCIREGSGAKNLTVIDDRFSLLPSWQDTDHLEKVVDLSFVDSRTHFSIMKRILPCVYDMLNGPSLQVLRAIRSLAELRMYAGFHIITPTRLAKARKARDDFALLIKNLSGSLLKEFNFPKLHYVSHLLDHLWRKCASRHYNTILGEGMHVLMKATFRQTNAKEFEAQMASQFDSVAALQRIRRTVDLYNQAMDADHTAALKQTPGHTGPHLEAPESPVPVHFIDSSNHYNVNHFEPLLRSFLASLAAKDDRLSTRNANPLDSAMVFPFKRLRVPYVSYDDWSSKVDLVHAHPSFHGKPRYDAVIFDDAVTGQLGFARLRFLFRCRALGRTWDVAVVSRASIVRQASEGEIRMIIVEECQSNELILTSSIKRAAFLSPTFENGGAISHRSFVNDLVDYDMILRLDPTYVYGT